MMPITSALLGRDPALKVARDQGGGSFITLQLFYTSEKVSGSSGVVRQFVLGALRRASRTSTPRRMSAERSTRSEPAPIRSERIAAEAVA